MQTINHTIIRPPPRQLLASWHCLLWLWLLWAASAWADDAAGGFLWRIDKAGQPMSYLIGTVHLGQIGSHLAPAYQEVLQQSEALVVESREEDWQGLHGLVLLQALYPLQHDPQTLRQQMGTERLQKVNHMLRAKGSHLRLDEDAHTGLWLAFMLVATDYSMPGYSMEHGVDVLLLKQAKARQMTIESLETLEPMLAFERIPKPILLRAMDAQLRSQQIIHDEQRQLLQAYHEGKSEQFVRQSMDVQYSTRYLPKQDRLFWQQWLFDEMLQQRNSRWLPKIMRQLRREPSVIAVGAAHLYGGSGLLQLLREQGYRVSPVLPR